MKARFSGISLMLAALLPLAGFTQEPAPPYVPEQLKPWIGWVLERDPDRSCAVLEAQRVCAWPSRLSLQVEEQRARFEYQVWLDREGDAALPGGGAVRPVNTAVTRGAHKAPLAVMERGGTSFVRLPAGASLVTGEFAWETAPKSLRIPPGTALLELSSGGRRIEDPRLAEDGELWLGAAGAAEEQRDTAALEVFRKLHDGVPFDVVTRIRLRISGRERALKLGRVELPGATPVALTSPLAYAIAENGELTVQAKPGDFEIIQEALFAAPPETLARAPESIPDWPKDEVWTWIPEEQLRSVAVTGGLPVDSGRTALPPEWQGFATFVIPPEEKLVFQVLRRGEERAAPNTMSLQRTLWLDLDGRGFTARDQLELELHQGWRLDADEELRLQRVSVGGTDQLITKDPKGALGVELRDAQSTVAAESRLDEGPRGLPVTGWKLPAKNVSAVLNLPPGWSLIEAVGVDQAEPSLLGGWTLFDLFLVMLAAAAAGRLLGLHWGLLLGLLLVVLHKEPAAPHLIWFHLLAALALVKHLPPCAFRQFCEFYYKATWALLALVAVAFSAQALKAGLYPQIGEPRWDDFGLLGFLADLAEDTAIGWTAVLGAVWCLKILPGLRWYGRVLVLAGTGLLALWAAAALMGRVSAPRQMPEKKRVLYHDTAAAAPAPMMYGSTMAAEQDLAPPRSSALLQNDPKAVVQTGLGIPDWQWRRVELQWSGAVEEQQHFSLYLLSPAQRLALSLIQSVLLLGLAFAFLRALWPRFSLRLPAAALPALLWAAAGLAPEARAEDFPAPELLKELQQRLTKDDCRNDCAALNRLTITVEDRRLRIEGTVSSRGRAACGLPGPLGQFNPEAILIDQAPADKLRGDQEGFVWARLQGGAHTLLMEGQIRRRDLITLQFPTNPQHVTVAAPGWSVDGLTPTGSVNGSLQLSRTDKPAGSSEAETAENYLPPWYVVERSLALGLPWKVTTTVKRTGSAERPTVLKLGLLPGESPASGAIELKDGAVTAAFPRGTESLTWESILEVSERIPLKASAAPRVTEVWRLDCSPIWSCRTEGTAPLSTVQDGRFSLLWRPYPGDEAIVTVARPPAAGGQAATVDRVDYRITPGLRLLQGTLDLEVRSSQGGFQAIKLPEGVKLEEVSINGRAETARHAAPDLALPLQPGSSRLQVAFSLPQTRGWRQAVPPVSLGASAANVRVSIAAPPERWIIFADPSGWGPAVLFWSKLIWTAALALLLGAARVGGLGALSWLLLGLGTATLPVAAMAVPVVWFFALHFRRVRPLAGRWPFNFWQIGLGLLSLAFVLVLFAAAHRGLVLYPAMQIDGGGSSNRLLQWYRDLIDRDLPRPWMITAPLWLWRGLMLAWACWAALALLGWLRWGFDCFVSGGFWRGRA